MADSKITVYLADDHQLLVDGIKALVDKDPFIQVIGHCNDGLQVLSRLQDAKPDVLVLDISLPGVNGLDLCRLVHAEMPEIAIMMLTMHSNRKCIVAALENGATGYLIKEVASGEFCDAVHAVSRGEIFLGQGIPKSVMDEVVCKKPDPFDALSDRERQMINLIAAGNINKQISDDLETSCSEVDTGLANLMQKLDLHDQVELIKFAIRKHVAAVD